MTMSDHIRELLGVVRERTDKKKLDLLETGSIRSNELRFRDGDGWSTLALGTHVRMNGGTATSIDLDTTMASQVLSTHGLDTNVKLIEGHSIDAMAAFVEEAARFDFILLDTDNDAQLTLHEWYLAKRLIRKGGVIMVDDVEPRSRHVLKGNDLVPHLELHSIPYELHKRTKNNVTTGICVVNF